MDVRNKKYTVILTSTPNTMKQCLGIFKISKQLSNRAIFAFSYIAPALRLYGRYHLAAIVSIESSFL